MKEIPHGTAATARHRDPVGLGLRIGVLYCVVSMATLPFKGALWLSELPLLAIPQLPKLALAGWVRTGIVMPVIRVLGLSRGSFSPDYVLARPWALAIAYLVPLLGILALARARARSGSRSSRRWACALLAAAALDFLCTLRFAGPPGISLY